jgi:hypothetical protein
MPLSERGILRMAMSNMRGRGHLDFQSDNPERCIAIACARPVSTLRKMSEDGALMRVCAVLAETFRIPQGCERVKIRPDKFMECLASAQRAFRAEYEHQQTRCAGISARRRSSQVMPESKQDTTAYQYVTPSVPKDIRAEWDDETRRVSGNERDLGGGKVMHQRASVREEPVRHTLDPMFQAYMVNAGVEIDSVMVDGKHKAPETPWNDGLVVNMVEESR